MRPKPLFMLACAVLVLAPVHLFGQSDGFALTGINFNFSNPGARARGIGGAFVAIADDSTAALANPAGLAYLGREVAVEGIADKDEFPVGQLTQGVLLEDLGLAEVATALDDPYRVQATSKSNRLNYASFLLPVTKYRMTTALYYATLADMSSDFTVAPGVMCVGSSGVARLPGAGEQCRFDYVDPAAGLYDIHFGQEVSYALETRLLGTAVGWRVSDTLSLGASVAMAKTTFRGTALQHLDLTGEENEVQYSEVDDTDLVYSAGILYRHDLWGFGLSYRSQADHPTGNRQYYVSTPDISEEELAGRLTVPDRLAAGIALFPSDRWVIAAEVDRLSYSDVMSGMQPFSLLARTEYAAIDYRISDVTEYHLGVEYTTFKDRQGWSLRAGYWRDRTHLPWADEPYTDGFDDLDGLRARESLIRTRFDEAVHHFTAGMGMSDGQRIRVDVAVDFTEEAGTDFLLSTVLYF